MIIITYNLLSLFVYFHLNNFGCRTIGASLVNTSLRHYIIDIAIWNFLSCKNLFRYYYGRYVFFQIKPNVNHKIKHSMVCHSQSIYGSHWCAIIWTICLKKILSSKRKLDSIQKLWQNIYWESLAHMCLAMPYLGQMWRLSASFCPNVLVIWVWYGTPLVTKMVL